MGHAGTLELKQYSAKIEMEWLKWSGNYILFFNKVGGVLGGEPSEARAKGLLYFDILAFSIVVGPIEDAQSIFTEVNQAECYPG